MRTITGIRASYERKAQTINSRMARKHTDYSDDGEKIKGLVFQPPAPEIDRTMFGDLSVMAEVSHVWERRPWNGKPSNSLGGKSKLPWQRKIKPRS